MQLGVANFSCSVRAHRFKDVLDRDIFPTIATSGNGATVEHEPGDIQARQSHRRRRNCFVAAHHAHHSVEHLPTAHQFDGIGNDFAAHQRGSHTLCAHRLAIADGDGVELHGRTARGADSFFHLSGKAA